MFDTIAIPVWGVWLAGILALIGLLDRILLPTMRWYLKRRLDRAVEVLNDRLDLKIPSFKLTKRRVLIDRLVYDPQVVKAILAHCEEESVPFAVAEQRAERYAREIVPSFSATGYFAVAIRLARWISTTLYRVRLGYVDEKALKSLKKDATVVFIMNHRSNMDYVLVTYLAASRSALAYAVGEWARVWPLKPLIKSMGGYFIRRRSQNKLYRQVLARYVQMATEAGVAQAVFPEGRLSQDGKLQPAKLGLLNYIISGFDPNTESDVHFVPVGLNYDRVLEDRILISAGQGQRSSALVKLKEFMRFVGKYLWLRVRGRMYRFGYASVSFGKPISLKEFLSNRDTKRHEANTKALGKELMARVGEAVPVLPVALIARIFLRNSKSNMTVEQIKQKSLVELDKLLKAGAYMHIPHDDFDYAVEVGMRMLVLRHAIEKTDDRYALSEEHRDIVSYYANSIAHLAK